jgi:hypothetical protein
MKCFFLRREELSGGSVNCYLGGCEIDSIGRYLGGTTESWRRNYLCEATIPAKQTFYFLDSMRVAISFDEPA